MGVEQKSVVPTSLPQQLIGLLVISALIVVQAAAASTLAELDTLLAENDIDLARSERRIQIAAERERAATAALFPQANAQITTGTTERERLDQSQRFQGETYQASVSQVIFDAGLFVENDRLSALNDSERAAMQDTHQTRRLTLVQAYARWREAHLRVPLLVEQVTRVAARRDRAERLVDSGRISIAGLLTAESELDRARAEVAQARSQLQQARSTLVTLIGDAQALDAPVGQLPAQQWRFDQVDWVTLPINQHPSVRAAQHRLFAAQHRRSQAGKGNWPTLTGQVQFNRSNRSSDSAQIPETDTAAVQVVASWNFFDSGVTRARKAEARVQVQDAQLVVERSRRDLIQARAQAQAALANAEVAWQRARDELASATRLLAVTDQRLGAGVGTIADDLAALERVTEAKIRLQSRWLDGLVAIAEVLKHQNALDRGGIDILNAQLGQ
jgi:outer membrane protein TolC